MRRWILPLCCLIMIAGCARQGPEIIYTPGGTPHPAPPRQVTRQAVSAASFVATAGAIDLFVIRSSELALQRSSRAGTRDFARQEIEAHKALGAQLSLAGRRLNLLPSATLPPKYQALIDRLTTAPDFDATYRQEQLQVHREALTLDSNYAAAGRSPTLRPVAASAASVIQRHLRQIPYL